MASALTWAFVDGISIGEQPDGSLLLLRGEQRLPLTKLRPGVRAAIVALDQRPLSEDDLAAIVAEQGAEDELPSLFYYLGRFAQGTMLRRGVSADGVQLATATPIARGCRFKPAEPDETTSYVLSRFAYLHRDEGELLLESPLNQAKIALHGWQGAAIVQQLGSPATVAALAQQLPGVGEEVIRDFLALFLGLDIVCTAGDTETTSEDANVALRQWEFHDLLFHARSRMGRHSRPFGGTFPYRDSIPPLPALKPPMSDEYEDLYKPDLDALIENDVPFTAVMERRRSVRAAGDDPITAEQLGEFLYRVDRVKSFGNSDSGEYAFRVFPGGGGEYELELYLAINSCEGLFPGFYHYAPGEHRLYKLTDLDPRVYTLLGFATHATVRDELPDVLIVMAARFQRVSWKYQSIAYSIILKDVGVLLQTMYLVATAMGLAPCAVGSGDSELFTTIANTDYYVESSVGEFLLGAMPSDTTAEPSGAALADMSRGYGRD